MLAVIVNVFLNHRSKTFFATILLLIISCYGMTKLSIAVGAQAFFNDSGPLIKTMNGIRENYSSDTIIGLVIAPKSGDIFDRETLRAIRQFTEDAMEIPYSGRVASVTNYKYIYDKNDGEFDYQMERIVAY